MNYLSLRGMAITKYGTIKKFAEAMGWSYRKAAYIIQGRQEATASDIQRMADSFEIELPDQFRTIFFTDKSTKCGLL